MLLKFQNEYEFHILNIVLNLKLFDIQCKTLQTVFHKELLYKNVFKFNFVSGLKQWQIECQLAAKMSNTRENTSQNIMIGLTIR